MTQYSKTGFKGYWGASGGPFAETNAASLTGAAMQQYATDIADSTLFSDSLFNTDVSSFDSWDWWNGAGTDMHAWATFTSGAGAGVSASNYGADTTNHAIGCMTLSTGTTAGGVAMFFRGVYTFGYCAFRFRHRTALEVLSTGAQTYTTRMGFGDAIAAGGEHTNGAFFRYTNSVNSGKWQAVTRAAGVETATDTTITADTSFHRYEIRVNQLGTSVEFYIDDVLKVTNTTNIPTTNTIYASIKMDKSVGATARLLDQDWYDFLITRSTAR